MYYSSAIPSGLNAKRVSREGGFIEKSFFPGFRPPPQPGISFKAVETKLENYAKSNELIFEFLAPPRCPITFIYNHARPYNRAYPRTLPLPLPLPPRPFLSLRVNIIKSWKRNSSRRGVQ